MKLEYDGFIVNVTDPLMEKQIKKFINTLQRRKANPKSYKNWDKEDEENLLRMNNDGLTVSEIAKLLNRTHNAITIKLWHLTKDKKEPEVIEL